MTAAAARSLGASQKADASTCTFLADEITWIQRALDGWEQVSRDFLRLDPTPLPWIVLFDSACIWHLSPDASLSASIRPIQTSLMFARQPVPVRALVNRGTVALPNGAPVSTDTKASTSLYRNGRAAFFVMAMPSAWQSRDMNALARAEYLQGVFSHEMTHTRLLIQINRRVLDLTRKNDLAYPVNDDLIQAEFQRVPGFRSAFNRERDHFFRAALEADPAKRRQLTERTLEMVRARHAKYFSGSKKPYGDLESLFLTMEGVGQWAAFKLTMARIGGNTSEALRLVRENRKYWSQEEGLALFLLIDALVPNWQSRIFSATPVSPFALLEEAIAQRAAPAEVGTVGFLVSSSFHSGGLTPSRCCTK
jgi:hypothetical protein